MKRLLPLLLALALVTAGCGRTKPEPSAPADSFGPAEVLEFYGAAAQVYDWFDLSTLPLAESDRRQDGERVYYRVDAADLALTDGPPVSIATLSDLRACAETYFSPEVVDGLFSLSPDHYRDFDGVLYAQDGARGQNIYLLDKTLTAEAPDDAHRTVTVTFWADSWAWERPSATVGFSQVTLHCEQTPAGWRFTDFCPTDALDLSADTVSAFTYDIAAADATDLEQYTPLQLALYLLHSDGALTEAAIDALFFRCLEEPAAVVDALASLHPSWQEPIISLLSGFAVTYADSDFQPILAALPAETAAQQAIIDALLSDWAAAGGKPFTPKATEFSLIVPGERRVLTLGAQEGPFPWGCDLTGVPVPVGDVPGSAYEVDCGDVRLTYTVRDGKETLSRLSTDVPYDRSEGYLSTARGLYCGYTEAQLHRIYLSAVRQDVCPLPGYDVRYVYAPGGEMGSRRISFYLKDGVVALVELEDPADELLPPLNAANGREEA